MTLNIGIHEQGAKTIAQKLSVLLADTYLLYLKTQNFHWNITGVHFHSLHGMFEGQYGELAAAVDEIAERVRTLGHAAPASFKSFLSLATLSEAQEGGLSSAEMLQELLSDHETLCRNLRDMIITCTDNDDEASADFLTGRLAEHEKTAWMLRSSL